MHRTSLWSRFPEKRRSSYEGNPISWAIVGTHTCLKEPPGRVRHKGDRFLAAGFKIVDQALLRVQFKTGCMMCEMTDDGGDPLAKLVEHSKDRVDSAGFLPIDFAELDLAEYAKGAEKTLAIGFPDVVFTSGRRTVVQQANAMAGNVVANRRWIEQTYKASTERDTLQKWVDDNPSATTRAAICAGLGGILATWTDGRKARFSRHFAGLAFDVRPTDDAKLKAAIQALPNLVKFLDQEAGITIRHAEFKGE